MPGKSFGVAKGFRAKSAHGSNVRSAYAPKSESKPKRSRAALIAVAFVVVVASLYFGHASPSIAYFMDWLR
jgi:hypothetical protein